MSTGASATRRGPIARLPCLQRRRLSGPNSSEVTTHASQVRAEDHERIGESRGTVRRTEGGQMSRAWFRPWGWIYRPNRLAGCSGVAPDACLLRQCLCGDRSQLTFGDRHAVWSVSRRCVQPWRSQLDRGEGESAICSALRWHRRASPSAGARRWPPPHPTGGSWESYVARARSTRRSAAPRVVRVGAWPEWRARRWRGSSPEDALVQLADRLGELDG
jgi:hypothetical protein